VVTLFWVVLKRAMWTALGLAILATLYALAAVSCALLTTDGRPQRSVVGDPPVYACATALHVDIVMRIDDDAANWRATFPDITLNMP
jgi:hypothetical protein